MKTLSKPHPTAYESLHFGLNDPELTEQQKEAIERHIAGGYGLLVIDLKGNGGIKQTLESGCSIHGRQADFRVIDVQDQGASHKTNLIKEFATDVEPMIRALQQAATTPSENSEHFVQALTIPVSNRLAAFEAIGNPYTLVDVCNALSIEGASKLIDAAPGGSTEKATLQIERDAYVMLRDEKPSFNERRWQSQIGPVAKLLQPLCESRAVTVLHSQEPNWGLQDAWSNRQVTYINLHNAETPELCAAEAKVLHALFQEKCEGGLASYDGASSIMIGWHQSPDR